MPSLPGLVVAGCKQRWLSVALCSVGAAVPGAVAGEPALDFDFGRVVACREVALEDSADAPAIPSGAKLVEFTLRLSVHVRHGSADDVREIQVEISDYDRRVQVYRLSPSTQLTSEVEGPIEVTRVVESTLSAAASLGGELPNWTGGGVSHLTPTANANLARRELLTEKKLKAAPMTVVVTSGTIHEEHGALFKLRPSLQTSLEGVHPLTVQLIVPRNWRADAVFVRCQAVGEQKLLWIKQRKVRAMESDEVALYLEGDAQAHRAAQAYVRR